MRLLVPERELEHEGGRSAGRVRKVQEELALILRVASPKRLQVQPVRPVPDVLQRHAQTGARIASGLGRQMRREDLLQFRQRAGAGLVQIEEDLREAAHGGARLVRGDVGRKHTDQEVVDERILDPIGPDGPAV